MDDKLAGILSPRSVLGETAILGLDGPLPRRTAAVVALSDGTVVTEYAVGAVKQAFQDGTSHVAPLVLTTMVSHICRNGLLILAANKGRVAIEMPVKGMLQNIAQTAKLVRDASTWDDFYFAFRFFSSLRDFSDLLRSRFVGEGPDRTENVQKASAAVGGWFSEHGLESYIEELVKAEQEEAEWLASNPENPE
jgi:hypothetical protein